MPEPTSGDTFAHLENAIRRARVALAWEDAWPRLVPVLSVAGLYVVLSWFGFWRLGGDWLRLGALCLLTLALCFSLFRLARFRIPGRLEGMRRVELLSGLPHRPARGLADTISPVAADGAARALWAANQRRLAASLKDLRAGAPRPDMARRDPHAWRFAVPVLIALAFTVAWGEWTTRLGEAFSPVAASPEAILARVDAWIDPPPYTGQAPVFLSRRVTSGPDAPAGEPISVPEGSKLTVRVVSREPAEVSVQTADSTTAVTASDESRQPSSAERGQGETGEVIRSYGAVLDRDATIVIAHADGSLAYPVTVVDDRPPTVERGKLTVNRAGSFTQEFQVADDYGVTEGTVTFRAAEKQPDGARPLVEAPSLPLRIDRAQAKQGTARADGRLESHPYAGLEVVADAVVKDAAGQEGRPTGAASMVLPARPFYKPLARALIEQRRLLALDANRKPIVAAALDALTIAPERLEDSGVYLALRVAYHRLTETRTDDELRDMLAFLWDMARAIEDGDMSDSEERLSAARQALEQALKDGAAPEEVARLMDELRQAMQEFLESYAAEMAERGLQNMPMPSNEDMQQLSEQDLQKMLDRIEDLAQLGDTEAAQELLSQLQQMLDNLQMAQPGQMSPADQQMMQQMDEIARMMREQQQLMDDTFQLNQGRRPSERQGGQEGEGEPLTAEEMEELMRQLQEGQGQLAQRLQELMEQMQNGEGGQQGEGQQGQNGEGQEGEGQDGQNGQGQNGQGQGQGGQMGMGEGGRALGRAGRAMGDASRSLGTGEAGEAYGHQGDALSALREGMQSMMQQMQANQQGQPGQQPGRGTRPNGQDDPLGRPQRNQGPDLGQNVKVPDEIDVERARQILEAIRNRLGERTRPRYELDYLERLLNLD